MIWGYEPLVLEDKWDASLGTPSKPPIQTTWREAEVIKLPHLLDFVCGKTSFWAIHSGSENLLVFSTREVRTCWFFAGSGLTPAKESEGVFLGRRYVAGALRFLRPVRGASSAGYAIIIADGNGGYVQVGMCEKSAGPRNGFSLKQPGIVSKAGIGTPSHESTETNQPGGSPLKNKS